MRTSPCSSGGLSLPARSAGRTQAGATPDRVAHASAQKQASLRAAIPVPMKAVLVLLRPSGRIARWTVSGPVTDRDSLGNAKVGRGLARARCSVRAMRLNGGSARALRPAVAVVSGSGQLGVVRPPPKAGRLSWSWQVRYRRGRAGPAVRRWSRSSCADARPQAGGPPGCSCSFEEEQFFDPEPGGRSSTGADGWAGVADCRNCTAAFSPEVAGERSVRGTAAGEGCVQARPRFDSIFAGPRFPPETVGSKTELGRRCQPVTAAGFDG